MNIIEHRMQCLIFFAINLYDQLIRCWVWKDGSRKCLRQFFNIDSQYFNRLLNAFRNYTGAGGDIDIIYLSDGVADAAGTS